MAKPAFKSIVDGKSASDPVRTTIAGGNTVTTTTTTTVTTTSETTTTTSETTTSTTTSTDTNTTTTTTVTGELPVTLAGDANNDGQVDMGDAVLIMQCLANPNKFDVNGTDEHHITVQGKVNADVDKESEGLTTNDALCIQEYLLGKIKSFSD